MKILVTGGAGFIGSHFADLILLDPEYSKIFESVTILDTLTYASNLKNLNSVANLKNFNFIRGNICNQNLIKNLIKNFDWVVNFAAETHVDRSLIDPYSFVNSNIIGLNNILVEASNNPNVKVLQVSTDEVYGTISHGSWDEQSPLKPRSPYSASKASGDLLANAFGISFGVDVRITRCSNNFGPRQHSEKMIPTILKSIIAHEQVPIYGDGNNVRDWLYVTDHARGVLQCLIHGESGQTYNIGGGTELSNLELYDYISSKLKKYSPSHRFVEDRKGHDFRYSISYNKSKDLLGYKPRVSFESGLDETIAWYLYNLESS